MAKCKQTKKALLSSVIALILCCSMLIGTTFAWFTDSVESGTNHIIAGNLDVDVYYGDPADKNSINGVDTLFDDVKLWEPGAVAYENLTVKNLGTLALKYALSINFENENWINGTYAKLSQVLKIAVVKDGFDKTLTREQVLEKVANDQNAKWELLSAWAVNDFLLNQGDSHTYGIVIWWEPSSDDNMWNVNNGKTTSDGEPLHIDLGVKLVATQKDAESDSFGNDYDKTASVTVAPGESIAQAINDVEDGGIVFLEPGVHNVPSGPIVIENKSVSIIGMGKATINKNFGSTHLFTIMHGAEVVFENIHMDGQGNTREGIYVRWDSKVTLKNCSIKNTGGLDIMIDEASDAAHGEETASYVTLINTDIEDVAMCASPVTSVAATQDTFVYFNYDKASSVGAIDVQSINEKPENVIINGVASTEVGKTMQLYASNDAELSAVLNTIKTDSNYWNKNVIVYLAAGEYSGNYTINQYPQWNGIAGAGGNGNNYAGGVPAGAPNTVITFVGEAASTYSMRAASTPVVIFTGKVTINGFGNAGTGFGSTSAITTFQNVAFDGANIDPEGGNVVAVKMTAAADNVYFENCAFRKTTHITLGDRAENRVDNIYFSGCTFIDAGSLSGYPLSVELIDCVVDGADGGFLNIQNQGVVNVTGLTANVGRFFIRTNGSGVVLSVKDSDITVYESEGTKHLVYFRGSGESAKFADCEITTGYTMVGVDADSELTIYNDTKTADGLILRTDGLSDKVTFLEVPEEYEGTTVIIPEGVDAIANFAFDNNSNVKEVVLASTVRDLGRGFDSSTVEKVVLNEGLTAISSRAFRATTALKEVVIPSSVTVIEDNAFQKSGIKEIVIPASVTTIGETAFGASLIETVTFEGDIAIQGYAFRGCPNLRTVYMKGLNVTFVASTLNGRNSMWFCNGESNNPNTSNITFYVKNEEIKARVLTAMGAEKNNTVVICEQTTAEGGYYVDSEGNAIVYGEEALTNALEDGKSVIMVEDVKMESATTAPYGNKYAVKLDGGMLDGNGNELHMECYGDDYGVMTTGGTIKNLTIQEGCRAVMIMYATDDIILDNVKIGGDGVLYPINTGEYATVAGVDLIVTNSVLAGWTSYAGIESASFTNVAFEQGTYYNNIYGRVLKPYVNTTLTNCSFVAHMNLDLSGLVSGHKITIVNCTVDGQAVTADVFTIPSNDAQYDTELFTVDLPAWASSITDCINFG